VGSDRGRNSLFGKTESVETWCAARPGIARLVKVSPLDCDGDLHRAIADALGIEADCSSGSDLRRRIEYVLKYARLGLVFDEAHRLVPQKLSRNTVPTRLEWIRSRLAEEKVPCVLVVTPQSYETSVTKFLRKTRFAFEQINGRMFAVRLPDKLSFRDLMSVARLHFPDVSEECLGVLAARAGKSQSYLKDVEHVAKRARYLASKVRRKVTMEDIDAACAEIMPQTAARPAGPLQPARKAVAEPVQPARNRGLDVPSGGCDRNRFFAHVDAFASR
jgi:hypothetical protein